MGAPGVSGLSMQAAAQRAATLAAALSGNPAGVVKPHYEAELEINDFPQHARWKVSPMTLTGELYWTPNLHTLVCRTSPGLNNMGDSIRHMTTLVLHTCLQVTHRETIMTIAELTGAAVITKGLFIPPGKNAPEGERKIYLLIEGPTETSVKRAKQELKRVLEETTEKVMRRDAPAAGKYSVV